jgi:hypothetical protein
MTRYFGHVDRDEADDLGVDVELVEIDVRVAELAAEGLGDVLLGQVAELDERGPDRQAVLLLEVEGGLQLFDGEDLFPQEQLAQVGCHFLFRHINILDNSCQFQDTLSLNSLKTVGEPILLLNTAHSGSPRLGSHGPILSQGQNASITRGEHCLGEISKNCLLAGGELPPPSREQADTRTAEPSGMLGLSSPHLPS